MSFQVSVVIPVYNAALFIREAVQSALDQSAVQEVLLVEDGSSDDSLAICKRLASEHARVKLFQHDGGVNLGAGASRNRGIAESRSPYIAFLDADDVYLPGRFAAAADLFQGNPACDGAYETVGTLYQDAESEHIWRHFWSESHNLTTLTQPLLPHQLFDALVFGGYGHLHLDGLTLTKPLLDRIGGFFPELRIGQDTALCIQAAILGSLYAGRLQEPVAMRRVHGGNRILKSRQSPDQIYQLRAALANHLNEWAQAYQLPSRIRDALHENSAAHTALALAFLGLTKADFQTFLISRSRLIREMVMHPELLHSSLLWKRLLPDLPYSTRKRIRAFLSMWRL